jgi:hypothetical protein
MTLRFITGPARYSHLYNPSNKTLSPLRLRIVAGPRVGEKAQQEQTAALRLALLGAEIDAEMEHQTARETTTGASKPLGSRGAQVADTVGSAQG